MSWVGPVSRRDFLRLTGVAGTGLILGCGLTRCARGPAGLPAPGGGISPDAILQVTVDGKALIWVPRSEMGQGVRTALPMIVAEELEIDWDDVVLHQADAAADRRYGSQSTGGSRSVRKLWTRLRRCGAAAREMLLAAAAKSWAVEPAECVAEHGEIVHPPSGRREGYGALAERAAELPVPGLEDLRLKDPETFRLVGTDIARVDEPDFDDGSAVYGIDQRVPGMLYAAAVRCPVFGGEIAGYDASDALAVPGVRRIVELPGLRGRFPMPRGVAVVADRSWAALKGARELRVEWEPGPFGRESSGSLIDRFAELAGRDGEIVREDGDAGRALDGCSKVVEAVYSLPFLAHAPMEPMNCTAHVRDGDCEVWTPTQNPRTVLRAVSDQLDLPQEAVTVHVNLIGGAFGRRLYPDVEIEAVTIAREVGAPVKLLWSREDDIRHDRYRPASLHCLRGGLDGTGRPIAWSWKILNTHTERFVEDDFPAGAIPNYHVEYTHVPWGLPRGAWRATTHSQNPFVVQSFLDELAVAAGRDPLELRLRLLRNAPRLAEEPSGFDVRRMIAVIRTAAEKADWSRPRPAGEGRGIAFQYCYESYVAQVAEVEVSEGRVRVRRVVCAVDCGQVVHPDMVRAQVEGAIAFGLGAALNQEITVAGGRVEQSNFHDFEMLTLDEMPNVETHIAGSREPPGGMGETPLPPVAPAVANAVFDATGTRIRTLPLRSGL